MNLLQICTKVPFPPKDGGSAAVYAFAKTFAKLGHHVDILAANPAKHFVSTDQLEGLPFKIYPVKMNTGVAFTGAILNMVFSNSSYHVQRFQTKAFRNKLTSLLTSNTYDVILIEGIYLSSYLPLIRKYSHARISLRAHNVEHLLWQDIAFYESRFAVKQFLKIQSERLRNFEIHQSALVDSIVCISEKDENVFRSILPNCKIITIPFGIDPYMTENDQLSIINTIFYIGALDWIPNQEALIWFTEKVWPRVLKIYPHLNFHIAGRNAPARLIEILTRHKNIVFDGEVESSFEYMKSHDLMVVPLFAGSGMRVKIIEAMNYEKSIVASDKACEGIPVENEIHLRIAHTIDEFVSAIEQSVRLPQTNIQLIKEAKKLVIENFDNLVLASKLLNFYRQDSI